jgi:hypothetical protein
MKYSDRSPSKIVIEFIPHETQRYPTAGDYWVDDTGNWQIRVSRMSNWKHQVLIAVHELVEKALCVDRGITDEEITEFDKKYEADRVTGAHPPDAEPGDNRLAPYRKEHFHATNIERLLAEQLGVDWEKHDHEVVTL